MLKRAELRKNCFSEKNWWIVETKSRGVIPCEGWVSPLWSVRVSSTMANPTTWFPSEGSPHPGVSAQPTETLKADHSGTLVSPEDQGLGGKWFPKMLSIYRKHLVTKTQTKKQNILESVWNFKTLPMLLVCVFLYTSIESPVTTNEALLAFQSVVETSQSPVSLSVLSTCWPHASQHPQWFINIHTTVWDKKLRM